MTNFDYYSIDQLFVFHFCPFRRLMVSPLDYIDDSEECYRARFPLLLCVVSLSGDEERQAGWKGTEKSELV